MTDNHHGTWEPGVRRWKTRIGRRYEQWFHYGPIGRTVKRLEGWLFERYRASGNLLYHRLRCRLPTIYGGGGTCWEWPWQPRTCSACGGVHPEDALRLIREGWEVEPTDKRYKAYLEPPGSRGARAAFWRKFEQVLDRGGTRDDLGAVARWSAVPPVKAYFDHWSEQQLAELIRLDREQAGRAAA